MKQGIKQAGKDPKGDGVKARRDMRSFEADADVGAMLDRAIASGIKTVFLCNESLREYLTKKGFARKRDIPQGNG